MSEPVNTLLLAPQREGDDLAGRLGEATVLRTSDPYDALREMGRRRWASVVLAADEAEFPSLCRASRRLQKDARLVAMCMPAAEHATRPLAGCAGRLLHLPADAAGHRRHPQPPARRLPGSQTGRAAAFRRGSSDGWWMPRANHVSGKGPGGSWSPPASACRSPGPRQTSCGRARTHCCSPSRRARREC